MKHTIGWHIKDMLGMASVLFWIAMLYVGCGEMSACIGGY